MPTRNPSHKPEYWDPHNPTDKEELGRDIERAIESGGPTEETPTMPPFDPLEHWWQSLPESMKNELAARAEDYASLEDFLYKDLGKNMDFGAFGQATRERINKHLDGLISDAVNMRADPKYARGRIDPVRP